MTNAFLPGQRWLSDAEPELGLGTVEQADPRRVQLAFPATGEQRLYARASAPLTRVRLAPGDHAEDRDGRRLTVVETRERDGLLDYRVEDADGAPRELPEALLNDRLQLDRPQDRLLGARLDADAWFHLRYLAWERLAREARSPVLGLAGPRVSLIPHQLYIAAEVSARHAPRVLLADEVGLGKTIEAGLILHRLLLSGQVRRVLILVPEPLLHQWLVEMRRRFNLTLSLFDRERFDAGGGDNPFLEAQRVLCGQEYLCGDPRAAQAAAAGEWDLLVVDEAHHLGWSPETGASPEYALVQTLAERTPALLLLTATPEQLGRAGHFARLRLLDPRRFHDYAAFLAEERGYAPLAALASRLSAGEPLAADQEGLLARLLGEEARDTPGALVRKLVDRHGTGRVLFRNTRAAVRGFPGRRLREHPLPLPPHYPRHGEEVASLLVPERYAGEDWTREDPRLPWLAATLRDLRPAKVLAICALPDRVQELATALRTRWGIQVARFHQEMEIVERDRAAAWFADPQGSQLLLCSEIGSEGRNFQFAHHLVLLDLPLEPDLLEQRIGRLDRIGQTETIQVHVPYFQGGAGETLVRWYRDGLGAFQASCPAAGAVYRSLAGELAEALRTGRGVDELIERAADLTRRLNAELERGRDRLLELNAHHPQAAARLVDAIRDGEGEPDLRDYMQAFWDAFGVEHEPGPGRSSVLHPGPHMHQERFPALPEEGATVTFERADALAHEDREFLTWEHPMVRGALELLTGDTLGAAALTLVRHPGLKPGTPLLELLYLVECSAPPGLGADRFLPPTCLRLVLDAQGGERGDTLSHAALQGQCLRGRRKLAESLLKALGDTLRVLIRRGGDLARARAEQRVERAVDGMEAELDGELSRLRALAAVNPNVRPEEIGHLEERRSRLAGYLRQARVRLDAARVIVAQ